MNKKTIESLEGKVFNKLTVLSDKAGLAGRKVPCRCECGKDYIGSATHLVKGQVKSCGRCKKVSADDMVGKQYGYWTVLDKQDNEWVLCQCQCGETRMVWADNIKSGRSKSCGCYQKERTKKAVTKYWERKRSGEWE